MSRADKEIYEFADFRLNVEEQLLLKKDERVQLTNKAFDILCLLVRENNHLVGKDEILQKVWAGAFVEENNLEKNISSLRHALGEREGKQKFIETVRGRGYRFVAEVKRVEILEPPAEAARLNAAEANESNLKLETSADQKPKLTDRKPNPQSAIQNRQSNKVVALAQWRRDEAVEESEKAVTPETIADGQIAAIVETPPQETIQATQTDAVVKGEKPIAKDFVVKSARKSKVRLVLITALSLIALAGISFAVYMFVNPAPLRFEAKNVKRLTQSGRVKVATVSPDGKFIVYSQEELDGQQTLHVKHIGSDSDVQISAPTKIEYQGLNISPDGNHLYYTNEKGTLYKMPVLGGAAKKIAEGLYVLAMSSNVGISPDSKQIAFPRRFEKDASALFVADANGGNEQVLVSFEQPLRLNPFAAWSPDGKTVACRILTADGRQNILVVNVADKTSALVSPKGWGILFQIAWLPDSKSLLTIMRGQSRQVWQTSYPGGEERQISNDTNDYSGLSLTSDGRFLATIRNEQVAHIWTTPSNDSTHARQITTGFEKFDGINGLGWMPDGKIFYISSPSGNTSMWVVEADGSNPKQLLAKRSGNYSAISPDGRFVVSQKGSSAVGGVGLYRTNLSDGSEKQLTKGISVWATFSPDGKWIVYTRYGERVGLWKVPTEGGEARQIIEENGICPTVSPDGKTVAFVLRRAGQPHRIALVSFEGGEILRTFDVKLTRIPFTDKQNLQWTADGRAINYISVNDGVSNIWRQPVDGSSPMQVTHFKEGRIFDFAFSADGSQLALSRGTYNSDVVLIENAR